MPSPPAEFLGAVVQMNSGEDPRANLDAAEALVAEAVDRQAQLVVLPELFSCLGRPEAMLAAAETDEGPTWRRASAIAAAHRVWLLAGSIPEMARRGQRFYNTSVLFGPDGRERARYRKLHLFDVDLPGRVTFHESKTVEPGEEVVCVETPLGRLGLAICYDLRFPELFRRLADAGAELFLVPSAFARETGRDHWEVLVRSRAIENQVYVLAANQFGPHGTSLTTLGRSMIVDPWGIVLAAAPDGPGVAVAKLSQPRLAEIRRQLPALRHRRLS